MTATRKTLDQQRAEHAWGATERAVKELGNNAKKEFGAPAKELGPRILTAELGPALQFLIAKQQGPKLVDALQDWLLATGPTKTVPRPAVAANSPVGAALIGDIVNGDSDRLRWLTAEALAYLAWLTRFCEARDLTGDAQ